VDWINGNPINGRDPTGQFGIVDVIATTGIQGTLANIHSFVGGFTVESIKRRKVAWGFLAISAIAMVLPGVLSLLPGTVNYFFGEVAETLAADEAAAAKSLVNANEASEAAANTVVRFPRNVTVIDNIGVSGADLIGVAGETAEAFQVTAREVTQLDKTFSASSLIGKVRDEMYQFSNIGPKTVNGVTKAVNVINRQVAVLVRGVSKQAAQEALDANISEWATEPYPGVDVMVIDQESGAVIGIQRWSKY
jgi:hypothetical protein